MTTFDRYRSTREALLRTVAYFDAIDYAPTQAELFVWLEWSGASGFIQEAPPSGGELFTALMGLRESGELEFGFGRIALPGRLAPLATLSLERTALFARKLRRARRCAGWLSRLSGVRFVALANTTALAHARDAGDLDFFIVVRAGSIWTTRAIGGGPYRLRGTLSGSTAGADAICLSYLVSDRLLNVESHMLHGDDPYFRFWFLSLLPLYDDGISAELWEANRAIRARHPRAERWRASPDASLRIPHIRLPVLPSLERRLQRFQERWFPDRIRERMNRDTSVIVSEDVLKFHLEDARAAYRDAFHERLEAMGLS